jgi:hypothetical protein
MGKGLDLDAWIAKVFTPPLTHSPLGCVLPPRVDLVFFPSQQKRVRERAGGETPRSPLGRDDDAHRKKGGESFLLASSSCQYLPSSTLADRCLYSFVWCVGGARLVRCVTCGAGHPPIYLHG